MNEPRPDDNNDTLDFDPNIGYDELEENNNVAPASTVPKPDEPVEPVEPVEPKAPVEPTPPTPSVSADDIAAAVTRGMQQAQPATPEEELTEDQLDEYLKRAKYSVDDLKDLGFINDDTPADEAQRRVQVFTAMQSRAVQEAVATSQVMIQHQNNELTQQFDPVIKAHKQEQNQRVVQHFYSTYPDLQPYEEIVRLATAELKNSGQLDGKELNNAMNLVASKSADLIKKYGGKEVNLSATPQSPQGQPTGQAQPVAQTPTSAVPTPAGSTSGGRSQTPSQTPPAAGSSEFDIYDR